MSEAAETPAQAYRTGLEGSTVQVGFWTARGRLVSNARLACFAALLVAAWLAFGTRSLAAPWLLVPAAAFAILVFAHDRVLSRADRAARLQRFYEDGLARLEHRFAGRGDQGLRYLEADHPYARDLDLFGAGSLFERLATTRTPDGSDRLAGWLLEGAAPDVIRERQAAVAELRPRLDLRRTLRLCGNESTIPKSPMGGFEAWARRPADGLPRWVPFVCVASTLLSLGGAALWIWSGSGPVPFAAALLVQGGLAWALHGRVGPILEAAATPVEALARISELLACLERERFASPLLVRLAGELVSTGRPPSQELARLRTLIDRRDQRRNQFFAPFAALLLWGTHVAVALEAWRARCGPRLDVWISVAAEIEALSALAGFAYEQPDAIFPEIVDDPVCFEGRALGHPLIAPERCVRNDHRLGATPQALVVSGSNMSGKSTFLRTLGCNTVLALAGAPVCAEALRLSPLRIAASIRIVDSLAEGQSHFMAEILRLRQVVEVSRGKPPALFLLDEILHGTNSHDRRIGAEAVIRGLVANGALGLVTTHDLALTQIVQGSAGRLANVHFEDHLEDGEMHFDYRVKDGVVTKSNAVALMRSVGLDV
jgi:hypothetical protein